MSQAPLELERNHSIPLELLSLTSDEVARLAHDLGWPRHRATQLLRWLYRKRAHSIDEMTDLSRDDRFRLGALAGIDRLSCHSIVESSDGTKKFLARLNDGLMVECVLIAEARRLTLCVSTQVGCTLDCRFCLTGTMGLKRNLTAHEIVDQVLMVQDRLGSDERLTSLVLMGMGEPLANIDAVSEAVRRVTNDLWGVGLPARRITLSTAGLASRMKEVAALGINLAVSLNATTASQREHLMPAASRLFSLDELMEACRRYPLPPRRRLTFEYVLLGGINDADHDAKRLAALLAGIRCKVNLIPFNEFAMSPFREPDEVTTIRFQTVLKRAGLPTFIRKSKGRDVLGACGQLGEVASRSAGALTPAEIGC